MLKLIGILTGSALAVAFLIIVLGLPKISAPESPDVIVRNSEQHIEIKEEIGMSPQPFVEAAAASRPLEPAVTATEPETEALIEQIFNPEPGTAVETPVEPTVETLIEENWYAFWSPFRSEIAADGFVSKLQETTGIDYRVVKVKTGVYEVAFAYSDDADIQDKLARISSATGLDMSGG